MRNINVEKFDPKKYAEYLDDKESRMLAARKLEGSAWHRKRRRSKVLAEINRLACERLGVTRGFLGQHLLQMSKSRTRATQRVSNGEIPRFERWLFACDLAGIPRADAVVLWARESIPDHFSEYKKYVGSTLKRRKLKEMCWKKNPTEKQKADALAAYKLIKDTAGLEYGARPLPELPEDIKNLTR